MTDRLNDTPGDDAGDLSDLQIAAANDAVTAEMEEAEAGGDSIDESEEIDQELDEEEAKLEAEVEQDRADAAAGRPVRAGARERAAETAAARASRQRRDRAPTRTAFPIDPALRIKDPASQIFVALAIGFFVLVFLYAMAFGRGGAFTPIPTATPTVSSSPAPSASPGASGSAVPTVLPTPAPTTAPTTVPTAAAS